VISGFFVYLPPAAPAGFVSPALTRHPFAVAVLFAAFPGSFFIRPARGCRRPVAAVTGVVFIPPIFDRASRIFWRRAGLWRSEDRIGRATSA